MNERDIRKVETAVETKGAVFPLPQIPSNLQQPTGEQNGQAESQNVNAD